MAAQEHALVKPGGIMKRVSSLVRKRRGVAHAAWCVNAAYECQKAVLVQPRAAQATGYQAQARKHEGDRSITGTQPEQYSGTPSTRISTHARFESCEADVSQRWAVTHCDCSRGLVRLWLRHDTLLGALRDLRTSGVARPFVLERLSVVVLREWCTPTERIDSRSEGVVLVNAPIPDGLASMLSVVNVQHTHGNALGPLMPASQIGFTDGHNIT